ncbi:MAG: SDR family oxidoreductase [Anaerolineae bacterium]
MILLVGATGRLGGNVARRLLAEGHAVRVLVHPDSDYDALERAGCEPILGDIKYPESFGPAFYEIETVISTASATEPEDWLDSYQRLDLNGNRNLIDAARAAGVGQFIFLSELGADPEHPVPYFCAKGRIEAHLRLSGMPYTILAAAPLIEVWVERLIFRPLRAGYPASVIGEGTRRHSLLSEVDLVAFTTAVIGHPAAQNQTLAVGGPEVVSWLDVVVRLEEVIGHEIPVQHYRPGALLPELSPDISQIAANFEAFDYALDMDELARTFGVALTPLDVTLSRVAGSLVI